MEMAKGAAHGCFADVKALFFPTFFHAKANILKGLSDIFASVLKELCYVLFEPFSNVLTSFFRFPPCFLPEIYKVFCKEFFGVPSSSSKTITNLVA